MTTIRKTGTQLINTKRETGNAWQIPSTCNWNAIKVNGLQPAVGIGSDYDDNVLCFHLKKFFYQHSACCRIFHKYQMLEFLD